MAPSLLVVTEWHCPACGKRDTTREARPHSRMHTCPRMRGLTTPMLRQGQRGKVELVERQDYVGQELVRLDPERRRPVQSIVVTRDDGRDTTVFAPTATLRG